MAMKWRGLSRCESHFLRKEYGHRDGQTRFVPEIREVRYLCTLGVDNADQPHSAFKTGFLAPTMR